MKNKEKGLTLVELLGVIVVIGIISLLVMPRIMIFLEASKKQTAIDSTYGYIKQIDDVNKLAKFSVRYDKISDGEYDVIDLEDKVEIKGIRPLYGKVIVENDYVSSARLCINGYIVTYQDNVAKASGEKCKKRSSLTDATITIKSEDIKTSEITVEYEIRNEIAIKKVECFYKKLGESNEKYRKTNLTLDDHKSSDRLTSNGTCNIKKLKENEKYKYKIVVSDESGYMVTEEERTFETVEMETPKIEVIYPETDKDQWYTEKILKLSGKSYGAQLQYQLTRKNGIPDPEGWQDIEDGKEEKIDYEVTEDNNLRVYLRLTDGTNIKDASTLTITKVDVTGVTAGLTTSNQKTDRITLTADCRALSGIRKYEFSKDGGLTWDDNGTTAIKTYTKLKKEQEYEFKVKCTSNTRGKDGKYQTNIEEKKDETKTMLAPVWSEITPKEYATRKQVTLTYDNTNIDTARYFVKGTTAGVSNVNLKVCDKTETPLKETDCSESLTKEIEANKWYMLVSGNAVVLSMRESGSWYGYTSDGTNTQGTSTLTVTKIDTAGVDIDLNIGTKTTSTVLLSATCSSATGIRKYEFSKDNGATWDDNGTTDTKTYTGLTSGDTYRFKARCTSNTLDTDSDINSTSYVKRATESNPQEVGSYSIVYKETRTPSGTTYARKVEVIPTIEVKNVTNHVRYIKVTEINGTSSISGQACGNGTEPEGCSGENVTNFTAGNWYKLSSNENPTITLASTTTSATVYARINDGKNYLTAATLTVTNIDTEPVGTQAPALISTDTTVRATIKQTDNKGIDNETVRYAIKKSGGSYSTWQTSNVFTGLERNTTYYVKTKANDIAGNGEKESSETSITTTTNSLAFDNTNWQQSHTVTATLAGNGNYYIKTDVDTKLNTNTTITKCGTSISGATTSCSGGNVTQNGTLVANNWYKVSGTVQVVFTANGSIYSAVTNGTDIGSTVTATTTKVDTNVPAYTSFEVKNISSSGYDVYVYGVSDSQSGINRVQFPTWTDANGQDDIQGSWTTNAAAKGTKQSDGTTWVYRVNVKDHKNETGRYHTHIYIYDNVGRQKFTGNDNITVPEIPTPTVAFDNGNWQQSHVATTTFSGTNVASANYFIKTSVNTKTNIAATLCGDTISGTTTSCSGGNVAANGTLTANKWYRVTGNASITFTENGSIYAATTDGTNIKNATTATTTKVDTAAPTVKTAYAGAMLYTDPNFASGANSIKVYNNSGNGTVTHARMSGTTPEGSYYMHIKTAGAASPGHGGFYFANGTAANKIFVTRIVARIPSGYQINWYSNATGTGGSNEWLTSQAGTGAWQEYIHVTKCGSSGSFSSTSFFALSGGSTATSAKPVEWDVAYATVIDTTKWGYTGYVISAAQDSQSGLVGYGLNQSSTSAPTFTTFSANSNAGKISSVTGNGTYYAWYKDGSGRTNKGSVAVSYVDRTAPTVASNGNVSPSMNSATVPIKITETQSGWASTKCEYGTSTSYGSSVAGTSTGCTYAGLINNTKYYFRITVKDGVGNETAVSNAYTGSFTTTQINSCTITPSNSGYATSKTYKIEGSHTGTKLQYKIGSGSWTDIGSGSSTASQTANQSIYCRLLDTSNSSNYRQASYTETKIDRTGPTCGSFSGGSTTWTSGNRTISVGCSETVGTGASGCAATSFSTTYSSTTKTATPSIVIKDNVGNTTTCTSSSAMNIYVDKSGPSVSISGVDTSSTTATVKASCSDGDSNITKYEFSKDNGSTFTSNGTTSTYKFTGLTKGTAYNFKVRCTNGATTAATSSAYSATTGDYTNYGITFDGITRTPSDTTWASSVKINVKYNYTNMTSPKRYWKVSVGDVAKNDISGTACGTSTDPGTCSGSLAGGSYMPANTWYTSTSWPTITIDKTVSSITIYGRIHDGNAFLSSATYTITKVDSTAPTTASVSSIATSTTTATVNASCSDGDSGISKYEFSKDNGSSYINNGTTSSYKFTGLTSGTAYNFKVRCTNGSKLTATSAATNKTIGSVSGTYGITFENASSTSSGLCVLSRKIDLKYNYSNITSPTRYWKVSVGGVAKNDISGTACGTSTNPGTCSGSLARGSYMAANTWYTTTSWPTITVDKPTSSITIYGRVHDGNTFLSSATYTITDVNGTAAHNSQTEKCYATINDAIAASSSGTITVNENRTENLSVASGKNLTLNLNGKTVTGTLTNSGTIQLANGTITSTSNTVTNKGTMSLGSANIKSTACHHALYNNGGTLNGGGGTIELASGSDSCPATALINDGSSTVDITGVTIKVSSGTGYGFVARNGKTNTLTGCSITSRKYPMVFTDTNSSTVIYLLNDTLTQSVSGGNAITASPGKVYANNTSISAHLINGNVTWINPYSNGYSAMIWGRTITHCPSRSQSNNSNWVWFTSSYYSQPSTYGNYYACVIEPGQVIDGHYCNWNTHFYNNGTFVDGWNGWKFGC